MKICTSETEVLLDLLCLQNIPNLKTEILSRLEKGYNWCELFENLHENPYPLPPKLVNEFLKRIKYCSDNCCDYFDRSNRNSFETKKGDVLAKLRYQHCVINKQPSYSFLTIDKFRVVKHIILHFRDYLEKFPGFQFKPMISPDIKKKWVKLLRSIMTIHAFESVPVKEIYPDEVENEVQDYTKKTLENNFYNSCYNSFEDTTTNLFTSALNKLQTETTFLSLCSRGSPSDITILENLLGNDLARVYPRDDPRKLINAVNEYNETAIYIATKNGNFNLVTFLLKYLPDIYIGAEYQVNKNKTEFETPLECACRWGYTKIIDSLLESCGNDGTNDKFQLMIKKSIKKCKDVKISNLLSCKLLRK